MQRHNDIEMEYEQMLETITSLDKPWLCDIFATTGIQKTI